MTIIKRYWNALDEASRKALKKAAFLALGMGLALLLVMFLVYFDVFFLGTMGDAAPTQFALMPAFMLGAIAIAIYSYVLAYRAHRAIKENLFAHPTPGLRTRETWTHADGFLLALALIGITSIPSAAAGLIMDFFLSSSPLYEPNSPASALFWPIVGLVLAPIAAKRYIPLPEHDRNGAR